MKSEVQTQRTSQSNSRSIVSGNSVHGHIKPLTNNNGIVNNFKQNTSQFFTVGNNQDGAEADLLMNMGKNTYQINLGNKKATFALNDQIFLLREPTQAAFVKDVKCVSCDKDLDKKNKLLW